MTQFLAKVSEDKELSEKVGKEDEVRFGAKAVLSTLAVTMRSSTR